ncbi:hypothetical protein GCM10020254_88380 [Streptomyces goshikiensis]
MAASIGLVVMVIIDSDAAAAEMADGGGGLRGVPAEFRPWILKADAACPEPEMTPALLASQLWAESKFKTSRKEATSGAGARGPAQFIPDTWATWGVDSDGNGVTSPLGHRRRRHGTRPHDVLPAQAGQSLRVRR